MYVFIVVTEIQQWIPYTVVEPQNTSYCC